MKLICILAGLCAAGAVPGETNVPFRLDFPRWGYSVRGGSAYHFQTDMDGGGAFAVNRYFAQAGVSRMWAFDRMVSVSAGFGQDDYRFAGLPSDPWNNIDNYRLGLFARWGIGDGWVLFAGPSVRSYGETGTDLDDALTPALFAGASYAFGDRLALGPGVVAVGQLEDDPRCFPVLLVDWQITERLSLETGGGLAATAGPGLTLVCRLSDKWKASLNARYEKKRFRLAPGNTVSPDGIGEDRSFPVVAGMSYFFYPSGSVGAIFGYNFNGNISVENQVGRKLYISDYDISLVAGVVASFRF